MTRISHALARRFARTRDARIAAFDQSSGTSEPTALSLTTKQNYHVAVLGQRAGVETTETMVVMTDGGPAEAIRAVTEFCARQEPRYDSFKTIVTGLVDVVLLA